MDSNTLLEIRAEEAARDIPPQHARGECRVRDGRQDARERGQPTPDTHRRNCVEVTTGGARGMVVGPTEEASEMRLIVRDDGQTRER